MLSIDRLTLESHTPDLDWMSFISSGLVPHVDQNHILGWELIFPVGGSVSRLSNSADFDDLKAGPFKHFSGRAFAVEERAAASDTSITRQQPSLDQILFADHAAIIAVGFIVQSDSPV